MLTIPAVSTFMKYANTDHTTATNMDEVESICLYAIITIILNPAGRIRVHRDHISEKEVNKARSRDELYRDMPLYHREGSHVNLDPR